jgi:hypothetical protein
VLRAAGETETTLKNIQDWLELDEGDPTFQLLTEEEIAALIFLFIFISTTSLCLSLWLYSHLNLGCFFSFLILYTVGRTPWMGDKPVAMPLPTHDNTNTE